MAMPTRPRESVPTKANVKVGDERYNDGIDRTDAVKERLQKKLEEKQKQEDVEAPALAPAKIEKTAKHKMMPPDDDSKASIITIIASQ